MPGLFDSKRWEVLPHYEEDERLLCESLGITSLVARVLAARGIRDCEQAKEFLHPSLERDWADPLDIPGMDQAVESVLQAITQGKRIAVFGDFDVDGMTSTCLLTQGLRSFGAHVFPYIPHRFGEGYGLSQEALTRVIADSSPELIITVDNGIASLNEVEWLRAQGIDVVITDHHEPGDLVPRNVPVTDPKLDENGYSRELAGAGVALKLVCELGRRLGKPDLWRQHTDLAALGTVSDMMLLQGENRSLVADGIERMRNSKRPGILALAATAGIDLSQVNADDLPFSLIPRLNAAGRMGTTEVALELLISEDMAEATTLAAMLEETNAKRREIEASLSEEALSCLSHTYDGERVVVLAGEGWHEGVKGIVASRIVNKYHVPTIVFSVSEGIARGSGRSVGSVDLFHAVEQCSDLLVRFGGHAGAVGVTCEVKNIDAFAKRLQAVMERLPQEEFMDRGEITAFASMSELTLEGIGQLEALQPFGQGNKRPLFGLRGVRMTNRARVGYDSAHLRFVATDGTHSMPAIMFRAPNIERACTFDGEVDLVVDAVNESWQGRTNPKLMVSDIIYSCDAPASHEQAVHCVEESGGNEANMASVRSRLEQLPSQELDKAIVSNLIGNNPLLPAQQQALERLAQGHSTLCVMATGRGKSLIFHAHAARMALGMHKASIFVYPLRALVSDQAFHLNDTLGKLGLVVRVLTGETPESERMAIYSALDSGHVDVVLTTPEYLAIHASDLARSGNVGFVVVDEAHHAGSSSNAGRQAYSKLPAILRELGNPVALAVSATASTHVSQHICHLLGILENNVIVDRTTRENLAVVDRRELADRDDYLCKLVSQGQKTVVYVNSRNQASMLVRTLRAGVPSLANQIAFYHAGLSRALRLRIEEAFRSGGICCIVSTSAFGEGVNLPDIRNVVLYHMPFGATEFNQMSGRAGRDGNPAHIHLLYGSRDARINRRILWSQAPPRDDLATLYRALVTEDRRSTTGRLLLSDAQLVECSLRIDERTHLTEASVSCGILVFEELGLCGTEGFGEVRSVRMTHSPHRVDLERSLRYAEGIHALEEFEAFCDWALVSPSDEVLSRINKPIVPEFGTTVDE